MVYTSEYILARQALSVHMERFDSCDKTVTEYTIYKWYQMTNNA